MSLSELLLHRKEIEALQEETIVFDEHNNKEKLNCAIYFDERDISGLSHDLRFKIINWNQTHNTNDHKYGLVVNLRTMRVVQGSTDISKLSSQQVNRVIKFMSRRAIWEALCNLTDSNNYRVNITPKQVSKAIVIIAEQWRRTDPDDYERDLAIFKSVAPDYNPIPLTKYIKESDK